MHVDTRTQRIAKTAGIIGGAVVGAITILGGLLAIFPAGRIPSTDAAAFVRLYLAQVPGPNATRVRTDLTTPSFQDHNPEFRTDGKKGFSAFWSRIERVTDIKIQVDPNYPDRPIVSYNYLLADGKAAGGPERSSWALQCWGIEVLVPGRDCDIAHIRLDATFAAQDQSDRSASPSATPRKPGELALGQPECKKKGSCKVFGTVSTTTGTGSVTVVAVDLYKDGFNDSVHVMVFDSAGELDWDQGLRTAYGMVDLKTDSSGHVFIEHAATNDTTEVLLIQVTPQGRNDFSTLNGDIHPNDFSVDDSQAGAVYVAREGLPARKFNPTTSRDRYVIVGGTLRWTGCQVVTRKGRVVEERPIGSEYCTEAVTLAPLELPESDRSESQPPP